MFHQHGVTRPNQSYRSALLRTDGPTEKRHHHKERPAGKWSAAANHLLQQSALRTKIDPNWVLLDSQST
eukprot:12322257-Ditylum_brightwellii.AAC.1